MAQEDLGSNISLNDFRAMSEKDQFAHVFIAIKAITHLERASKEADTVLERARSVFGVYNLKKNLEVGKKIHERSA